MPDRWNVIVVGGGIAGLAAAAFLRRSGLSVLLLERSAALGGRARTQESRGFHFNLGPHALYLGGPAERSLRELGVALDGNPPAGRAHLLDDRGSHLLPLSPGTLLSTDYLNFVEKFEMARLLDPTHLGMPHAELTVREWLGSVTKRLRVRALLRTLVRLSTYADDVERQSAAAAVRQLRQAATHGVLYLHRGWSTLVNGLERAAEGVELRGGVSVRRAIIEGGRARGVLLDSGEEVRSDAVLLAVGPDVAARLLPEARLPRCIPVLASCLDLALERLPDPENLVALDVDRPLYFSVHSAAARLAPEEGALVHVARYGVGERSELEAFCDRVQPGWRSHVVHARFLPRMMVSNALATPEGRPNPEVPGVSGLAIAGDWVGSEGMLADAALGSARQAARMIAVGCHREVGSPG